MTSAIKPFVGIDLKAVQAAVESAPHSQAPHSTYVAQLALHLVADLSAFIIGSCSDHLCTHNVARAQRRISHRHCYNFTDFARQREAF